MDFKIFNDNFKQDNSYDNYIYKNVNINDDSFTQYNDIINKYSSFTYDELKEELIKSIAESKRNGKITNEELDMMLSSISMFLDEDTKNDLSSLIEELKNEH